jgi:hypothetical protein
MFTKTKLFLIAAAFVGSASFASAHEPEGLVTSYDNQAGISAYAQSSMRAPRAVKGFNGAEKALFDRAVGLD